MLTALALLLQTQTPGPIVLPPGSSRDFQSMVYSVQAAVDAGKWDEAKRLAERLPSLDVSLEWDEAGLTESQRMFFSQVRDTAIKVWQVGVPTLKFTLAPKGKVKIGFVESLPENADSVGPAGAVFLTSPADGDPVVEAVLALNRTALKRPTDPLDVRNEVQFAIGTYLGLARQVRPGQLMFRTEEPYASQNTYTMGDGRLALKNIEISDRIRKDVSERKNPGIAAPQIVVDPTEWRPRPVGQAEEMMVSLQVANQGKGTLDYRLVPDCGCFVIGRYKEQLQPGETTTVPIMINTLEFTGNLKKALFIYSNDPYFPIKRVSLETIVRPAYRFVDLMKESSVIVDKQGGKFETILVLDEGKDFKITGASVSGVTAGIEVEQKPWEGVLDFPEIGEGPKKRKGYKINCLIAPGLPPGRLQLSIELQTDDKEFFKRIYHSVYVQQGIVAVPLSIYFGQVPQQPARASVVLTRPGRPYNVLKVESDTEFVTATVEPYRPGTEYKIVATFTGKAPIGRFSAQIKVHTDDPDQPIVVVPVEGIVK